MARLWRSAAIAAFISLAASELFTPKHEAGRCALRGTCGSSSWFSPALPCPDNGLAKDPEADVREKLVELCGPKWTTGQVCCEGDQVRYCMSWIGTELIAYRLMFSRKILRRRTISYRHVRRAKRTSTTSSAPSHAHPTNLSSSTSHKPRKVQENYKSQSLIN